MESDNGNRGSTVYKMARGDVVEEVTLEMKLKVSGSESGQAGKNNSAEGLVDAKVRRGGGLGGLEGQSCFTAAL